MTLQVRYYPTTDTFYVEERTQAYMALGKKQKKLCVMILRLQDEYERTRKTAPGTRLHEDVLMLRKQYERLTKKRGREKSIYLLKEEDVPEELPIRRFFAPPRRVRKLSENEYKKLLEKLSLEVKKRKTAPEDM